MVVNVKMDRIYVITVIYFDGKRIKESRRWGWTCSIEKAHDVIINNEADIFEDDYNLAVIEETNSNIPPQTKDIAWYKAYRGYDTITIELIERPKEMKNITNFGLG